MVRAHAIKSFRPIICELSLQALNRFETSNNFLFLQLFVVLVFRSFYLLFSLGVFCGH